MLRPGMLFLAVLLAIAAAAQIARVQPLPRCRHEIEWREAKSDTIFEGKARSFSAARAALYNVTFVVRHVYKGGPELTAKTLVRLQFARPQNAPREACPQRLADRDHVPADIRRGAKYVVFAERRGPNLYRAISDPLVKTRKLHAKLVRIIKICHGCAAPEVRLAGVRNATVHPSETLKLMCRIARGSNGVRTPLTLAWFKGKQPLTTNGRLKIRKPSGRRDRLRLLVVQVRPEDAGQYTCRAKNASGRVVASLTAWVSVLEETTTTSIYGPGPCPMKGFCLNGGTCTYYESIMELVCQCADGFKGNRCENKEVNFRGKRGHRRGSRQKRSSRVAAETQPAEATLDSVDSTSLSPGAKGGSSAQIHTNEDASWPTFVPPS